MLFKINALLVFGGANIEFFSQLQFYFFVLCALLLLWFSMNDDSFFEPLVRWYSSDARQLPWRITNNPYHIYISEIVFQQTRIDQGLSYYNRIISQYPDIVSLAAAAEDDFLQIWQGLGYYSRAHNLLKAARMIVDDFDAQIPSDIDDLQRLPGVGPYTAAAIASIAFCKSTPVVDGNVKRVISRLFCIDEAINSRKFGDVVLSILNKHIHFHNPSFFNQSLMEVGALICKPANPDCPNCPMKHVCCAFKNAIPEEFPVKGAPTARKKVFLHYAFLSSDLEMKDLYLVKRNHNGIWKGLYELPGYQSDNSEASMLDFINAGFPKDAVPGLIEPGLVITHQLTHRILEANVYVGRFSGPLPDSWLLVELENLRNYPFHRLMQKILKHFGLTD